MAGGRPPWTLIEPDSACRSRRCTTGNSIRKNHNYLFFFYHWFLSFLSLRFYFWCFFLCSLVFFGMFFVSPFLSFLSPTFLFYSPLCFLHSTYLFLELFAIPTTDLPVCPSVFFFTPTIATQCIYGILQNGEPLKGMSWYIQTSRQASSVGPELWKRTGVQL